MEMVTLQVHQKNKRVFYFLRLPLMILVIGHSPDVCQDPSSWLVGPLPLVHAEDT